MKQNELAAKAAQFAADAEAILANPEGSIEEAEALIAQAEEYTRRAELASKTSKISAEMSAPQKNLPLPVSQDLGEEDDNENVPDSVEKAVNMIRFSKDFDEPTSVVMKSIYGTDYRNLQHEEKKAFVNYLRHGTLTQHMGRQRWSIDQVKDMLKAGMTIAEIKSTMVEGQDTLGGYAVPAEIASRVLGRSYGLTAVRKAGALVIRTASKSIDFLEVTGGTSRYGSALRGAWGNETKNPDERNLTFGMKNIPVHIYTFKTPMSISLLEDASNVEDIFVAQVGDTLGIDEDEAFLIGNGNGRPYGLLPNSANVRSLSEQASLGATALTMDGLRRLPRAIQTQYRQDNRASWIGNSGTAADIETLKDAENRYFVDTLIDGTLLRSRWLESEAMPDVAASAYPLIYGDFSGYAIVERMGLAIQRYNDAYTGINVVEFHVRRRVGGDVIEPWKFAVQKVAAS